MSLSSQIESIRNELSAVQADISVLPAEMPDALRAELNALWMAIEAISASYDDDKNAVGL